jgi:hypothetical protein
LPRGPQSRRAPNGVIVADQRQRLTKFRRHRPTSRGSAALKNLMRVHHRNSQPLMVEMMNPLNCAFVRHPDRQPPDQGRWRPSQISRISRSDEGFHEGFDEPHTSSWSTWTPPRPAGPGPSGRPEGLPRRPSPKRNGEPRPICSRSLQPLAASGYMPIPSIASAAPDSSLRPSRSVDGGECQYPDWPGTSTATQPVLTSSGRSSTSNPSRIPKSLEKDRGIVG